MNRLTLLKESVTAGILIGFGGAIYLSAESRSLGAFMFAFGLLTILIYGQKLYTGAIGYWGKKYSTAELAIILFGNLIGTAIVGFLLRQTLLTVPYKAVALLETKRPLIEQSLTNPAPVIATSIFCGVLMFLGVDAWRKESLPGIMRTAMVFLAVAIFILSGFEHCIADMFYLFVAQRPLWFLPKDQAAFIALVVLGNSIGALTMAWLLAPPKE